MPENILAVLGASDKGGLYDCGVGHRSACRGAAPVKRFVPLALALLAPILVGIVTFHVFLAPSTIAPAVVALAMELYLAWEYRAAFRPMLAARTTTGARPIMKD
jgi:hypothetical protein